MIVPVQEIVPPYNAVPLLILGLWPPVLSYKAAGTPDMSSWNCGFRSTDSFFHIFPFRCRSRSGCGIAFCPSHLRFGNSLIANIPCFDHISAQVVRYTGHRAKQKRKESSDGQLPGRFVPRGNGKSGRQKIRPVHRGDGCGCIQRFPDAAPAGALFTITKQISWKFVKNFS